MQRWLLAYEMATPKSAQAFFWCLLVCLTSASSFFSLKLSGERAARERERVWPS